MDNPVLWTPGSPRVHCTACGATTAEDTGHWTCPACGHRDYVNPAPAVGAAVLRGDQVLLARRAHPPKQGEWDLVGGFLEPGESALDGLRREVREESGMELTDAELVDVLPGDYDGRPTLNLLYIARTEDEPAAADDVAELRWFPIEELPELAWPHEAEVLGRMAAMVTQAKEAGWAHEA